eukprot:ANDGO_04379.mRNA.1 hypothetical protein
MSLKTYWSEQLENHQTERSLRNEWQEASRKQVEQHLEERLKMMIAERPGDLLLEVRCLEDYEFDYPDRHKCRSFEKFGEFLAGDAKTEYDYLVRQGIDCCVLRKPVPGFRDSKGFMLQFFLCARFPAN